MKLNAQRYFRNYRAVTVTEENGKTRTRLLYLGDRYVSLDNNADQRTGKRIYFTGSLLSDGLLLLALTRNILSNRQGILAALSLFMLFPAFFATFGSIRYLFRKQSMTVTEYRESTVFGKIGFGLGGFLGALIAGWRWILFLRSSGNTEEGAWIAASAFTALAAVQLICFIRIMRERYRIIPANQIETELEDYLEKGKNDNDA